ncbi:MAG: nucleotidyl transferase AbiEii/AbiGii toxin family protein [Chloroflexi bacterium]|nr:MAG: nucleotidyl transferase AbiEii/AbiGii toxin family protein [Chloroflexota bacterium]
MLMLEFQQIKEQYPENLQRFERLILREYLQYKILQAIFDSKHASKLAFLGGTALRIVYGNTRFSEDIDLDNFGLSWEKFEEVIDKVNRFLSLEGFEVEVKNVKKGTYHCDLRFPKLLYDEGLSPLPGEKLLIQVDTTAQGYKYQPEVILLNKFDVFAEIRVTPLDTLLSQKIYTAVNRKRPKGRDFYDITFLASRTKPDYGFLKQKMDVDTEDKLKEEISSRIADYDFTAIADDVAPFLINQNEIKRVEKFPEFWEQAKI